MTALAVILPILGILLAAWLWALCRAAALADQRLADGRTRIAYNRACDAACDYKAGRITQETFDQLTDEWRELQPPDGDDVDDERAVIDWPLPQHVAPFDNDHHRWSQP